MLYSQAYETRRSSFLYLSPSISLQTFQPSPAMSPFPFPPIHGRYQIEKPKRAPRPLQINCSKRPLVSVFFSEKLRSKPRAGIILMPNHLMNMATEVFREFIPCVQIKSWATTKNKNTLQEHHAPTLTMNQSINPPCGFSNRGNTGNDSRGPYDSHNEKAGNG